MKLTRISNFVTSKLGRQALVLQKHSPKIMFVAGVIGVGATVVLACRATLKVDDVLQDHEKQMDKIDLARRTIDIDNNVHQYTDNDAKRDKMVVYSKTVVELIKLYGPSVVIGTASIAMLTGAHVVLSRRNVGLTAAYAAIEKGFREYRQRVSDEYGPDKERELRYDLTPCEVEDEAGNKSTVMVRKSGDKSIYARCFDELSTSWVDMDAGGEIYNPIFLRTTQAYMNDLLRSRGHVTLNDVYDALGMPRTKEGFVVGWVLGSGGDDYIDFGVFEGDTDTAIRFVRGEAPGIWLDFNVDGVIYDKI